MFTIMLFLSLECKKPLSDDIHPAKYTYNVNVEIKRTQTHLLTNLFQL